MLKFIAWYLIIGVVMIFIDAAFLAFYSRKMPNKACEGISEYAAYLAFIPPDCIRGKMIGKIMIILMAPILSFKWVYYCIKQIDEYKSTRG